MEREVLLKLKKVDISFDKVRVVKNVSLQIFKGETFSLVGESGSGKTTIGRAIIGVTPCSGGEIEFRGERISGKLKKAAQHKLKRQIQMVFQDPASSLNERATVEQIVSEGLRNFRLYKTEQQRRDKVTAMLCEVGLLPEHLSRYPHEFSGGQRQRIGIARAMVIEPELVIADEPISALDVSVRAQVLNLMKRLQQDHGTTYLFIAHDLSVVRHISDRIGVIYKGELVELAQAEELFRHPLHPYTRSLLSAIPIPDPKLEREKRLLSYNPGIHDYGQIQPEFTDIGNGHWILGSPKELEAYKNLRENGTPIPEGVFIQPREEETPPAPRRGGRGRAVALGAVAAVAGVAALFGLCLLLAVL